MKGVADTNAAALDKCLEALQVYLQTANESHASRCANSCAQLSYASFLLPKVDPMRASSCICRIAAPVSAILATKVLKQRPGTVQRAKDVYLCFCELEQADTVVVRQ